MEATSSGGLNLISPVPGLVLTILFTAGRIGAEIETATAQQQQALFDYLPTIQTGLREVEDSLIATPKIREQQAEQDRQVQGTAKNPTACHVLATRTAIRVSGSPRRTAESVQCRAPALAIGRHR